MAPNTRTARKRKATSTSTSQSAATSSAKNSEVKSSSSSSPPPFYMILSPAKTLDLSALPTNTPIPWTQPIGDASHTQTIVQLMKQQAKSSTKLAKLLGISATLAATAKQYWEDMPVELGTTSKDAKPCGFAFSGAAYQGLQLGKDLDVPQLDYLQRSLRIVDPVYGWLRPMDVISPYRLEMATKGLILLDDKTSPQKGGVKLADYWKPEIAKRIRHDEGFGVSSSSSSSGSGIPMVNLASDEYSAAVDYTPMIKVVFRQEGRVIAVHAKRARGLMVRYCAEHQLTLVDELVDFDVEGYKYQADVSDESTLVFDRRKNWNTKTQTTSK